MKKVVATVVTPSVISVGGSIIFFNLGLIQSFIFPQIGLLAGIAVAMRTMRKPDKGDDKNQTRLKQAK
jgi:hypothetical protein